MSMDLEKEASHSPSPHPSPSPSPSPSPRGELRFVAVRANLLPNEVRQERETDATRRHVLLALGALVVLLGVWFGVSWWQTHSAQSDLDSLQRQGSTLQSQTNEFGPLVTAQAQTSSVQTQLQRLMVGDLSWRQMLATLQSKAPATVQLTQVSGTITSGAGAAGGNTATTVQSLGAAASAGTITITGSAHDKRTVANFADVLGTTKGLSSPFVNSVTAAPNGVTFNLTVLITSDALGGRWTPSSAAATTPGGK